MWKGGRRDAVSFCLNRFVFFNTIFLSSQTIIFNFVKNFNHI